MRKTEHEVVEAINDKCFDREFCDNCGLWKNGYADNCRLILAYNMGYEDKQKDDGIQWHKYPDEKPRYKGLYNVRGILEDGTTFVGCMYWADFYWDRNEKFITKWCEIPEDK